MAQSNADMGLDHNKHFAQPQRSVDQFQEGFWLGLI